MPAILEPIEAPLTPDQLVERWQAICRDPTFEDIAGKIELTEWIVFPQTRAIEFYDRAFRRQTTAFPVGGSKVFE